MVYKLRFGFAVLAMMLVSIVMYIIIHESGHALVAALCGADNVKISILSSITWYTGGSFTAITEALFNVAGIDCLYVFRGFRCFSIQSAAKIWYIIWHMSTFI